MSKFLSVLVREQISVAEALIRHLPLNLGHQVLLATWVRPVRMALMAHQAHPDSGALPGIEEMWELLEQLDRQEWLDPRVSRDLRARLVRLEFREVRAPLDHPVPVA